MFDFPLTAVWFGLFIVFVAAELITAMTLVSIWFCFGALAAMFAAMAGVPFWPQTIIFLAVSILLLILTKPFVKRHINSKIVATNAPALIGGHGIVTEKINNIEASGAVKVDGKIWTARTSSDEEIIPEGAKIEVLEIKGVKLIVKMADRE